MMGVGRVQLPQELVDPLDVVGGMWELHGLELGTVMAVDAKHAVAGGVAVAPNDVHVVLGVIDPEPRVGG